MYYVRVREIAMENTGLVPILIAYIKQLTIQLKMYAEHC